MRIILLVVLLIPIFIFQSFIVVDTISNIKLSTNKTSTGTGTIRFNNEKNSKRTSLKVIR